MGALYRGVVTLNLQVSPTNSRQLRQGPLYMSEVTEEDTTIKNASVTPLALLQFPHCITTIFRSKCGNILEEWLLMDSLYGKLHHYAWKTFLSNKGKKAD